MLFPDYIFESSWEVCNKVGGIYTVLSTRAKTLQDRLRDHIIFIGPDFDDNENNPYFKEDESLFKDWKNNAVNAGLNIRIGRWNVPGEPIAILVDSTPFYENRDRIYARLWELYKVDSLHGYGDYDEANMFSLAAAKVVESFYNYYLDTANGKNTPKVVYHGNEWMACLGLLYINHRLPQIGTIFTTHATSIGRSIAGNNKPLYQYLHDYNGDQMAAELNMESKHSIEKQTAWNVDCFTTVSDITAVECEELLDKPVDVVLPNGFEDSFVPKGNAFIAKRKAARKTMLKVANALLGEEFDDNTLIIATSGRYEFRNKGIDVFIESLNQLRHDNRLKRKVVAFVEVPGWIAGPRKDLQERLESKRKFTSPLPNPIVTHELHEPDNDRATGMMRYHGIGNEKGDMVKVIFVPCYLDGNDGIFNTPYYNLMPGNDLCVFPSYYEPWGYTPLEAVAFKVPCITTNLAGFGLWARKVLGDKCSIENGVEVVDRDDYNYFEVTDKIKNTILRFSLLDAKKTDVACKAAGQLSKAALWNRFIEYYYKAYDIALTKASKRK
jgi:hypothetical protein